MPNRRALAMRTRDYRPSPIAPAVSTKTYQKVILVERWFTQPLEKISPITSVRVDMSGWAVRWADRRSTLTLYVSPYCQPQEQRHFQLLRPPSAMVRALQPTEAFVNEFQYVTHRATCTTLRINRRFALRTDRRPTFMG